MRDFLAWALILSVIGTWIVFPWKREHSWRLFGVSSDEELWSRLSEHPRVLAAVGLSLVIDAAGLALGLIVLL